MKCHCKTVYTCTTHSQMQRTVPKTLKTEIKDEALRAQDDTDGERLVVTRCHCVIVGYELTFPPGSRTGIAGDPEHFNMDLFTLIAENGALFVFPRHAYGYLLSACANICLYRLRSTSPDLPSKPLILYSMPFFAVASYHCPA